MWPDFESWYKHYPRKIGRGDAEKAYNQQIKKGFDPNDILRGVIAYAASAKSLDKNWIPYPATWLRAQRWLDEDIQEVIALTPEQIEINKDRADRLFHRGRYAQKYL
ncbi:MAG TPA: hypothetical protein VG892_07685 [Terriglobales bacterium]|nr:hypothetical protein [Terriglobales bacterium]